MLLPRGHLEFLDQLYDCWLGPSRAQFRDAILRAIWKTPARIFRGSITLCEDTALLMGKIFPGSIGVIRYVRGQPVGFWEWMPFSHSDTFLALLNRSVVEGSERWFVARRAPKVGGRLIAYFPSKESRSSDDPNSLPR